MGFVAPASAEPVFSDKYAPKAEMKAAADGTPVWVLLVPKHTDPYYYPGVPPRCADIEYNSQANGARTILWDCFATPNQQWAPVWVEGTNPDGTVMFINANSGKCLDLSNNSVENGAAVIQWTCHNGWNQQWEVVRPVDGDPNDYSRYQLKNRRTGKCLDVNAGLQDNGSAMLQWECHQFDNQKWTMYLP